MSSSSHGYHRKFSLHNTCINSSSKVLLKPYKIISFINSPLGKVKFFSSNDATMKTIKFANLTNFKLKARALNLAQSLLKSSSWNISKCKLNTMLDCKKYMNKKDSPQLPSILHSMVYLKTIVNDIF